MAVCVWWLCNYVRKEKEEERERQTETEKNDGKQIMRRQLQVRKQASRWWEYQRRRQSWQQHSRRHLKEHNSKVLERLFCCSKVTRWPGTGVLGGGSPTSLLSPRKWQVRLRHQHALVCGKSNNLFSFLLSWLLPSLSVIRLFFIPSLPFVFPS